MPEKMPQKICWEQWAKDAAGLTAQYIDTLTSLARSESHRHEFLSFLEHLQSRLSGLVTESDAIEWLAQHIIMKPVFDVLFDSDDFTKNNPVAQALNSVVDLLENAWSRGEGRGVSNNSPLDSFYASVRKRVAGMTSAEEKQKMIIELVHQFFKNAFPKMSDKLGIVYTPIEVIDFILHSVDDVLKSTFGKGVGAKHVHVLDPFTGTGTFIVRLLQSGLIDKNDLERKYKEELHANELVPLAYDIAAINIENTFREEQNRKLPIAGSTAFLGMAHADTFTMMQAKNQKDTPITVIIGNPPYSVGQRRENDHNKNTIYPELDERIRTTYVTDSSAVQKRSLYDSYVRAFRWASDRIGDQGVVGFVTNGGWLDGKAMDGLRKHLAEEFTDIYVVNLRGNVRAFNKEEGGNIFNVMVPIAITILVKNSKGKKRKTKNAALLRYYDIGLGLTSAEKLSRLRQFQSIEHVPWTIITPNEKHDWLHQRDGSFDRMIPLGNKKGHKEKDGDHETFFNLFSNGIKTSRDAWVYHFSKQKLAKNIERMIDFYHEQSAGFQKRKEQDAEITVEDFIDTDPAKISWTVNVKKDIEKRKQHTFAESRCRLAMYRPFVKQWLYVDKFLIERPGLWPQILPEAGMENKIIGVEAPGGKADFSVLMTNALTDSHLFGTIQCFPLYTYAKADETDQKYIRKENISDAVREKFQQATARQALTKEDIFYYVYGMLHSKHYRERFAADLKKQLPRIPVPKDAETFWTFAHAGRKLAALHVNYETGKMYPLVEVWEERREVRGEGRGKKREASNNSPLTQMRFPSKTDKSKIIYNAQLTLSGIPAEAYRYGVNGKSAIEWVMERYAVKTDKDSRMVNNPNDWCREQDNERYIVDVIKRVVYLSVESVKIIDHLPAVEF